MQSVFRGRVVTQQRRRHTKSRNGCEACKTRHRRCNEKKPACDQCSKSGNLCVYTTKLPKMSLDSQDTESCVDWDTNLITPCTRLYSMSVDLLSTTLSTILHGDDASLNSKANDRKSHLRLFQHFESAACSTIGDTVTEHTMRKHLPGLAWKTPYLLHMALAFASAHLKRLVGFSTTSNQQSTPYVMIERHHWHIALKLFQNAFPKFQQVAHVNVDSEIAMTLLSTAYTFSLDDDFSENFFFTISQPLNTAWSPLAAGSGVRAYGKVFRGQWKDSAWAPVLAAADDCHGTFTSQQAGIAKILPAFVRLCELDDTSCAENNKYHTIVRALTPLLLLVNTEQHFGPIISFGGRTWHAFSPLLEQKDHRGLLLLAYWLVLLCRFRQWWLETRAKTECAAIVHYLSKVANPEVQALLPFPATLGACGFELLLH